MAFFTVRVSKNYCTYNIFHHTAFILLQTGDRLVVLIFKQYHIRISSITLFKDLRKKSYLEISLALVYIDIKNENAVQKWHQVLRVILSPVYREGFARDTWAWRKYWFCYSYPHPRQCPFPLTSCLYNTYLLKYEMYVKLTIFFNLPAKPAAWTNLKSS